MMEAESDGRDGTTVAGIGGMRRIRDDERKTAFTGRRWVRWTGRMKRLFLDHLAATCHVGSAAAAIGVDPSSVYALRRRDPEFVAAWGEALELGYEMLETLVVGHALAGGGRTAVTGAATVNGVATGPIDVDFILRVLSGRHASRPVGRQTRGGARKHVATREETDAAILARLAAYDRKSVAEAASPAGGE